MRFAKKFFMVVKWLGSKDCCEERLFRTLVFGLRLLVLASSARCCLSLQMYGVSEESESFSALNKAKQSLINP